MRRMQRLIMASAAIIINLFLWSGFGSQAKSEPIEKFPEELVELLEDAFQEDGWRGVRELLAAEGSSGVIGQQSETDVIPAWNRVRELTEKEIFRHFPLIEEYQDQIIYEYEPYDAVSHLYRVPKELCNIYYLPESDKGEYAFLYCSGKSGGEDAYSVRLAAATDYGIATAAEFDTQNNIGEMFRFGQEYYFIYGWKNDVTAEGGYDGFMLHRLTVNPKCDTLLARYTPEGEFILTEGEIFVTEKKEDLFTMSERRIGQFGYIVYDNFRDFEEERNLPFADHRTFERLKEAYAAIEFEGEYLVCDEETNTVYLEAFRRLVQNKVTFYDPEKEQDFFLKDYEGIQYDIEEEGKYDPDRFEYYFFDADGDGFPDMGILEEYPDGHSAFLYLFRYDMVTETYRLWNTLYPPYDTLLGTRKVLEYDGVHMKIDYGYYQLDGEGEVEYSAYLYYLPLNMTEQICLVMLPAYADPSLNEDVTGEMKQCGIYAKKTGKWYFRVTEEQFGELDEAFREAYESTKEREQTVLYTYKELFER